MGFPAMVSAIVSWTISRELGVLNLRTILCRPLAGEKCYQGERGLKAAVSVVGVFYLAGVRF